MYPTGQVGLTAVTLFRKAPLTQVIVVFAAGFAGTAEVASAAGVAGTTGVAGTAGVGLLAGAEVVAEFW